MESNVGNPPWRRSWLYTAPGELPTFLWIAGLHLLAVVGLVLLPLPPLSAVIVAAALLALGGLGTTVAYHRAICHRAARLAPPIEQLLIALAVLNGSGRPRSWVANHRHHHRFSDTAEDISSPSQGFWWSHLRWLWQAGQADIDVYAPDLDRLRYRIWDRLQPLVLALGVFGGLAWALGGSWSEALAAALWIGPLRLLWALHAQCSVNSICHLGDRAEHGTSRNVLWLAPLHLLQGENWHANHHREPAVARLGSRWWQPDIGWLCLRTLAVVGLAARVRRD